MIWNSFKFVEVTHYLRTVLLILTIHCFPQLIDFNLESSHSKDHLKKQKKLCHNFSKKILHAKCSKSLFVYPKDNFEQLFAITAGKTFDLLFLSLSLLFVSNHILNLALFWILVYLKTLFENHFLIVTKNFTSIQCYSATALQTTHMQPRESLDR